MLIPEPPATTDLPFEDRLKSASFSTLTGLARNTSIGERSLEARSELHRRFAFPVATLLLGILALPLAIGRRQTSRSSGALVGVAITIGYYGLVQAAEGLVQKRPDLSALATWLPNAVLLGAIGLLFLGLALPLAKRRTRSGTRSSTLDRTASEATADEAGHVARLRVRYRALPRYVAFRFLQLALLSLTALVVAYLLVDVLERLQWFARHAARFEEIVHFYSARIPLLASRVTPMALVVAMALTVSVLTSTGELLGMRTLGLSSHRALMPALLLCGVATPLSFLLNDQIVPRTNELADMIKQSEIRKDPDVKSDRTAVWGTHGRTLYQLERLDTSRRAGRNIIVYEILASGLPSRRIDARRALHVGGGHWQLQDATGVVFEDPGRLVPIDPPANVELGEEPSAELDLMYLSVVELFALIREVAESGEPTTELEVDLHVKLATPLACLLLPALVMLFASSGPPFPGSALTLIVAGTIAIAYTLLAGAFASFGRGDVLPPWLGGWGPNLIGIVTLVGLMGRDWIARRRA
jgi:lipopolysaccharide export system permease protein